MEEGNKNLQSKLEKLVKQIDKLTIRSTDCNQLVSLCKELEDMVPALIESGITTPLEISLGYSDQIRRDCIYSAQKAKTKKQEEELNERFSTGKSLLREELIKFLSRFQTESTK